MEEGKRFSLVYLERGAPVRDSQRLRNRLSSYYREHLQALDKEKQRVKLTIEKETGARIPYTHHYDVGQFLERAELRDVLDSITLIYKVFKNRGYVIADDWMGFVARVLKEENVGYQLDSGCGVHFFIDEEFERNRIAALSALEAPELSGVRDAYEAAYRYLDTDPPDTKAAVRAMFEALEILTRQMVPAKNLSKKLVETTLKQKCLALYSSEPTAAQVVSELCDGFADWVNALHNYRHGQPSEQPVAPTIEVAVYVLSSGSAFLRWLVEMKSELVK